MVVELADAMQNLYSIKNRLYASALNEQANLFACEFSTATQTTERERVLLE